MKNVIKQGGNIKPHKGKSTGKEMFGPHRLDPDDKNFGNKATKKKLQVNQIPKKYL